MIPIERDLDIIPDVRHVVGTHARRCRDGSPLVVYGMNRHIVVGNGNGKVEDSRGGPYDIGIGTVGEANYERFVTFYFLVV